MKPVKNLVFATLLVSSIVFNTFAGEVQVPGATAPPEPSHVTTTDETTTVTSTDTQQTTVQTSDYLAAETSDYLIFKTLEVLLSVY